MAVGCWSCFWIEVVGVSERIDKVWMAQLWMLPHSSIMGSCWSLAEGSGAQEGYPWVLGCE